MTNETVKVSVIMLTYNQERYITRALDSVLMQKTDFPIEVLIGDDASADGTPDILREYAQRSPDVIKLTLRTENVGAARNAYELLQTAQGKYLAFCEGDDFWLAEDKLAIQVAFLEEHPDVIGCSCRCLLVNENGEPLPKQRLSWVKYRKRFTLKDFSGGRYLPGQTASIVKRNIFGGNEDYSILYRASGAISDRTSTAIYLTKGDFACLPQRLSAYRKITEQSGTNLTSRLYKNNENKCRDELELTKAIEDLIADATGRPVRFRLKRCEILGDAVIEWMRKPCARRWSVLRDMAAQAPFYAWFYLPVLMVRKIIFR